MLSHSYSFLLLMTEPTYIISAGAFLIHRHAVHVGLTSFFLTNDPCMKHDIMSGWELFYLVHIFLITSL